MTIKNRPYPFSATITQRFSAGILDIGMLLGLLIWAVLIFHWSFDISMERPRYNPPSPSDGWSRVLRSAFVWLVPLLYISLFMSSRFQATPGMMALHLKIVKTGDERVGFARALLRILFACLPLVTGNFLVLTGIALDYPLLYAGPVNIFSLLLLLQCLWLMPILSHRENKAIYDKFFHTKVIHYSDRPQGDPLLRKIFTFPVFLIIIALFTSTAGYAVLNLLDRPLHPRLADLEEGAPEDIRSLYRLWRSANSPEVYQPLNDPRCITERSVYLRYVAACRSKNEILAILASNRDIIERYQRDFLRQEEADEVRINPIYLSLGSVAVTDLVLADIIARQEELGGTSNKPFEDWLVLVGRWRNEITSPNFLLSKSYAFMHYNHALLILPELLLIRPDYATLYAGVLARLIKTIPLESIPLDGILAHEYALYDRMIKRSHIEFFPFTQPNYTRNQFMPILNAIEQQFRADRTLNHSDNSGEKEGITETALFDRELFNRNTDLLYNPLGNHFSVMSLSTWQTRMHIATVFDHNNALKRMLSVLLMIRKYNIDYADIPAFIEALPRDLRYPFRGQPLLWNADVRALYYTVPNMDSLRQLIFI